jgi:hypothetical protein
MNPTQFSLQTLLLCFVVVAAAVGLCGAWGILLAAAVLTVAAYIRMVEDRAKAWQIVIILLVLSSCLIGMLLPAVQVTCENTPGAQCRNNQRQITLALLGYEQEHGHLPPAYVADADGKPMHSWRVLILKYLDRPDLYRAYDFNEPWNGPHNSKMASSMPTIYRCRSNNNGKTPNCTSYVAVIGQKTAWLGDKGETTLDVSVKDGCARTVLLMEFPDSDINWLEPRDLSYEELCEKMTPEERAKIFDAHYGVSVVSFADGHQETCTEPFLQKYIGALLTVNGGEKIDFDDRSGPSYSHGYSRRAAAEAESIWPKIVSLIVLIGATLLIIYRPLPKADKRKGEPEEEYRFEDASAPVEKPGDGNGDGEARCNPPQPSPPDPLPKGEVSPKT